MVFSHLYYRGRDVEKWLGLTVGGLGILTFIFWAIFTMLGFSKQKAEHFVSLYV